MTEPTDAEILSLNAGEIHFSESPTKYPEYGHGTQYHAGAPGILSFARAVLAKWGTPAVAGEPVAWRQGSLTTVNQDPYPSLGDWFVQFWEGDDVAARVYGNDMETLRRRCAVIATPQPTQAQAGAVPLTDEQMDAALRSAKKVHPGYVGWVTDQRREWGRAIERAHGIKGGQHG